MKKRKKIIYFSAVVCLLLALGIGRWHASRQAGLNSRCDAVLSILTSVQTDAVSIQTAYAAQDAPRFELCTERFFRHCTQLNTELDAVLALTDWSERYPKAVNWLRSLNQQMLSYDDYQDEPFNEMLSLLSKCEPPLEQALKSLSEHLP